jgi:hypothetical protein
MRQKCQNICRRRKSLYIFFFKAEYSLRESVSAQGREGRGFDSDPGRNLKKKKKKKKKRLYSIS